MPSITKEKVVEYLEENKESVNKDKMFSELCEKVGWELTADFYVSIATILDQCKNEYARTYAMAIPQSYVEGGLHGVKVQLLYVQSNLQYWRGEKAKEVKVALKKVLVQLEKKGAEDGKKNQT